MLTSAAVQRGFPEIKNEGQPEPFPTNPEAQKSSLSPLFLSVTNDVINSRAALTWYEGLTLTHSTFHYPTTIGGSFKPTAKFLASSPSRAFFLFGKFFVALDT